MCSRKRWGNEGHEPDPRQHRQTHTGRRRPPGRQNAGHEPILGRPAGDLPTAVLELRWVDRRVSTIRHPEVVTTQTVNGRRIMVQKRRAFAVFVGERPVKENEPPVETPPSR